MEGLSNFKFKLKDTSPLEFHQPVPTIDGEHTDVEDDGKPLRTGDPHHKVSRYCRCDVKLDGLYDDTDVPREMELTLSTDESGIWLYQIGTVYGYVSDWTIVAKDPVSLTWPLLSHMILGPEEKKPSSTRGVTTFTRE